MNDIAYKHNLIRLVYSLIRSVYGHECRSNPDFIGLLGDTVPVSGPYTVCIQSVYSLVKLTNPHIYRYKHSSHEMSQIQHYNLFVRSQIHIVYYSLRVF